VMGITSFIGAFTALVYILRKQMSNDVGTAGDLNSFLRNVSAVWEDFAPFFSGFDTVPPLSRLIPFIPIFTES